MALSITKAEYIAIIEDVKELLWMKEFMKDLYFKKSRFIFFCDNQSVISLTNHFIFIQTPIILAECMEKILIEVKKIHTDDNTSNMLMKVLVIEKHEYYRTLVGRKLILSSSTWRSIWPFVWRGRLLDFGPNSSQSPMA